MTTKLFFIFNSLNINRDFEYSLSIEIRRTRFSENISSECMMYYVDALKFDADAQRRYILSSQVIIIQSMSKEEDQIDQALAQ